MRTAGSSFCDSMRRSRGRPRPSGVARFARAALQGGAAGIRANGSEDVRAIRQAVGVLIIRIWKAEQDDGNILFQTSLSATIIEEPARCGRTVWCLTRG